MAQMTIATDLDFTSVSRILNLPDATAAGHPVTFTQLNSAIEGLAWKDSCRVATQSNIDLSSPGATIDGITMATSDRMLVKEQTTTANNGIYLWNGAAIPATRSLDTNTATELEQATTTVEEGTSAGTTYRQTNTNFTLGSDAVTWVTFGTSAPAATETTAGIAELATQSETDTGTDDQRIVTPLKLATYANKKLKFTTTVGDGSATQYTITHNLGTRSVLVEVYTNSGNFDTVIVFVERTSTNAVRLTFSSAPTTNQYAVVILG
ncbi:MAG: hypothetical protein ACREVA_02245 [Burkholderiales bacterium]